VFLSFNSNLEKKFTRFLVFSIGLIVALLLGIFVIAEPLRNSLIAFGGLTMLLWVVILPQHWWVAVPAAVGIGGYFEREFKIYPHEVALASAMIPLVVALAMRRQGLSQGRPALHKACYFLAVYLMLHFAGSVIYNHYFYHSFEESSGVGNVLRAYLNALFGIGFIALFNHWGSTRPIRQVLMLIYGATWIRVGLGVYSYFTGSDGFIWFLDYNLQPDDLRFSGITLAILSVGYFSISSGFVTKAIHLFIYCLSGLAVLAGSSRSCLVIYIFIPLWLALVNRRYALLCGFAFIVATGVILLNLAPSILDELDPRIGRPFSIVLIDQEQADHLGKTSASDYWHRRLREIGFERWTDNTGTVVFGTGIRPFARSAVSTDESINLLTRMESTMIAASGAGAYESGFWAVLAVTGVVGLLLFAIVIRIAFVPCLRALMKDGISTHAHVFAFMGIVMTGSWVVLCWTYGGVPSLEIIYLYLGKIALDDQMRRKTTKLKNDPENIQGAQEALQTVSFNAQMSLPSNRLEGSRHQLTQKRP